MIILIFKQVIMNIWEYVEDKHGTGKRVRKVKDVFAERLRQEKDDMKRLDLDMHSFVEQQLAMKKEKQLLVGFYNEAMIQLGFIVFFAPVFECLYNLSQDSLVATPDSYVISKAVSST